MKIRLKKRFGKPVAIENDKFRVTPEVAGSDKTDTESTVQKDQVRITTTTEGLLKTEDTPRSQP